MSTAAPDRTRASIAGTLATVRTACARRAPIVLLAACALLAACTTGSYRLDPGLGHPAHPDAEAAPVILPPSPEQAGASARRAARAATDDLGAGEDAVPGDATGAAAGADGSASRPEETPAAGDAR